MDTERFRAATRAPGYSTQQTTFHQVGPQAVDARHSLKLTLLIVQPGALTRPLGLFPRDLTRLSRGFKRNSRFFRGPLLPFRFCIPLEGKTDMLIHCKR